MAPASHPDHENRAETDPAAYPTDDDGDFDHDTAVEQMFGHEPSRRHPVYINDGIETYAVIDRDGGQVTLTTPWPTATRTWDTSLAQMWDDWHYDELTFRTKRFLEPHEDTYNTETHAAVDRRALAELVDYAADDLEHTAVDIDSLHDAVDAGRDALNDER